jgi:hypothetical protein
MGRQRVEYQSERSRVSCRYEECHQSGVDVGRQRMNHRIGRHHLSSCAKFLWTAEYHQILEKIEWRAQSGADNRHMPSSA